MVDFTYYLRIFSQNSSPYHNGTFLDSYYTKDIYNFSLTETSSINAFIHNVKSDGDYTDKSTNILCIFDQYATWYAQSKDD